jgi:RHS repeat-associated protein
LALGSSGASISLSSAWRGRWVDITGYYSVGLRPYDPVSGRWMTYDSVWNERDPNAYTFCGGDPVNGVDPDGRCVDNAPQNLYMGIAPVMEQHTETTIYLNDGTVIPPGQTAMYDPSQVNGQTYNVVTQPTGQYQYYVSQNALPSDYGQATSTPITTWQVQAQQDMQFLVGAATVLASVATDTEEFAPDLLSADGGVSPFLQSGAEYSVRINPITGNGPMAIDTSTFTSGEITMNGGIRNSQQFWNNWANTYPETLSDANLANIQEEGLSPVVDNQWIQYFPEHSDYMDETLIHHHLDYGPQAIPLPQTVHSLQPGWGIWHQ